MLKLKYITPFTLFTIRKWQSVSLSVGGGHMMTYELLRYGLFVPDNAAFAYTFNYNPN